MIKIEKLDENIRPKNGQIVKVKEMGNITELMFSKCKNNSINIRLIDKDHYVILDTGELKECNHIKNRSENLDSVRKSLSNLRDTINTNVIDVKKCRWVTFTYKKNMTDPKKLESDFENFNVLMRKKWGHYEYIVAAEPQGRGAWHLHVILIFPEIAPYINNNPKSKEWKITDFWKHGFVTVKKLDDIDNIGQYLTAYLGDMELEEAFTEKVAFDGMSVKTVEILSDTGQKLEKKYVKGARLYLYPPKFRIMRCSRGIKKPVITHMESRLAQKKVSAETLTYEKTLKLSDSSCDYENIINYRYYNSKKISSQESK